MQTTAHSDARPAQPAIDIEARQTSALLAACGVVSDERVLIVGPDGPDTMSALIRRGARQVTALRHADRPEAGSADLVVAPQIGSAADAEAVLTFTSRALAPFGRVVLILPTQKGDELARCVARMLPNHALSLVRARRVGAWTLVTAERPYSSTAGHA